MIRKVLITGSAGLVGSEAVRFFSQKGFICFGIDNDMRGKLFGKEGSTKENLKNLKKEVKNYKHFNIDIRSKEKIKEVFKKTKFDLIIHTAAQPSHDWAIKEPLTDFSINSLGTTILLENFRQFCPKAVFIFTSSSKIYGDKTNKLPFIELKSRWELKKNHLYFKGINEKMGIDQCIHCLMGASKTAADIMVQEYGQYFGLKTVCFRAGCLTGRFHQGTQLHGFLAYLVKCIAQGKPYTILGYKGKQVRDNMHSFDLIQAFWHFYQKPKIGAVYNIGGSRHSNISIVEAVRKIEKILDKKAKIAYQNQPRKGDHIWYISNITKYKKDYPKWQFKYNIDMILKDLCSPYLK